MSTATTRVRGGLALGLRAFERLLLTNVLEYTRSIVDNSTIEEYTRGVKRFTIALCILILSFAASSLYFIQKTEPVSPPEAVQAKQVIEEPPTVAELLKLTNAERVKAGVAP